MYILMILGGMFCSVCLFGHLVNTVQLFCLFIEFLSIIVIVDLSPLLLVQRWHCEVPVWVGLGTGWAMPFHSAANSPWALCSGPVRGTRGSSSKDLMCQCINWPTMRSSFLLWADLDMGYGCSLAFFLEPSLVFTTQSISSAFQLHSTTLPQIFQYNSICYCLGYFLHVWEVGQETPVFSSWEVIIKHNKMKIHPIFIDWNN